MWILQIKMARIRGHSGFTNYEVRALKSGRALVDRSQRVRFAIIKMLRHITSNALEFKTYILHLFRSKASEDQDDYNYALNCHQTYMASNHFLVEKFK